MYVIPTALKPVMLFARFLELELILDVIDISNVPKSGPISEIPIQAAIGMVLAGYPTMLQVSTEPFHRE